MLNNYKNIKLNTLLKDIGGDSNISNKYISEHIGEYPVYSAKTTGDMIKGRINTFKYDMECLQITSDGAKAGTIIYRPKSKFSIGPATRVYYVNEDFKDLVDLKYVYYVLKKILTSNEYSWTNKATKYKIDEIEVPLPIDVKGNIDLKSQIKIVKKFGLIDIYSNQLKNYKDKVKATNIDFNIYANYEFRKVSEIFDLSIKTNDSKFTKGFIKENSGNIPVYGASKNENDVGYGYVKDNLPNVKYFENCLTYNIDASAGYVFYRKNRFSLSEKVRPLITKPQYKECLDPLYLKYTIQPVFRANIRGRRGPNGQNEYTKINKTIIQDLQIPIPIKENGEFDLKVQKEISEKYKKLEAIKEQVINEIDKVLSITVEI